jgi:hypothetical protein
MKSVTLDDFLYGQPWSDNMRHVLRVKADRDDLIALTAHQVDGRLTAQAWTVQPKDLPDGTVVIWYKKSPESSEVPKSKTMQAVELVLEQGMTVYAAAKQVGVGQSVVHRALARREDKNLCPCCGQVVREGFAVNPDVLKDPSLAPNAA